MRQKGFIWLTQGDQGPSLREVKVETETKARGDRRLLDAVCSVLLPPRPCPGMSTPTGSWALVDHESRKHPTDVPIDQPDRDIFSSDAALPQMSPACVEDDEKP